jgi:hypothetical protein
MTTFTAAAATENHMEQTTAHALTPGKDRKRGRRQQQARKYCHDPRKEAATRKQGDSWSQMFRLPLMQGCTSVQAGKQLAGGANDAHQTTALQVEQRQVVNVGEAPHRVLNLYSHSNETHYT